MISNVLTRAHVENKIYLCFLIILYIHFLIMSMIKKGTPLVLGM